MNKEVIFVQIVLHSFFIESIKYSCSLCVCIVYLEKCV